MSKGENAKTDRVLRDDELEFASGGHTFGISQNGRAGRCDLSP